MKLQIKTLSLLLLSLSLKSVSSQNIIPNSGFEIWDYYNTWTLEPEFWSTPNGQLIESVKQDSSAYEGELAMRVNVLPGFEGGVPQQASVIFQIDDNPTQLAFAVKANIDGNTDLDVVKVIIKFFIEDAQIGEDIVWSSFTSINSWELIEIDIPDFNENLEECIITVQAGETNGLSGGSWENWISVDAFSIEFPNNIEESKLEPALHPNPLKNNWLNISYSLQNQNKIIDIYNLNGQLVQNFQSSENTIFLNLLPSLYIIAIQTEEKLIREKLIIE